MRIHILLTFAHLHSLTSTIWPVEGDLTLPKYIAAILNVAISSPSCPLWNVLSAGLMLMFLLLLGPVSFPVRGPPPTPTLSFSLSLGYLCQWRLKTRQQKHHPNASSSDTSKALHLGEGGSQPGQPSFGIAFAGPIAFPCRAIALTLPTAIPGTSGGGAEPVQPG